MIGNILSGVLRQRMGAGRSSGSAYGGSSLDAPLGGHPQRSRRSGYGRGGAGALVGGLVVRQVMSAMRNRRGRV